MTGPAFDVGIGYAIRVPPSWFEIDLRPATRAAAVKALVAARIQEAPELAGRREEITRLIREQAAAAWDAGAVYCAVMAEAVVDGLLPGAVTVSFLPGPADASSDSGDRMSPLLAGLEEKAAAHPEDTWSRVRLLELPRAGPAVRVHGVSEVEIGAGLTPLRTVTMQTFVPLPGVNRVALVSCGSPAVTVADSLFDVFDAVTSTFSLFRAADLVRATP